MKPILKQLQQSIQTITQIHTEDGKAVYLDLDLCALFCTFFFLTGEKHLNVNILSDVVKAKALKLSMTVTSIELSTVILILLPVVHVQGHSTS